MDGRRHVARTGRERDFLASRGGQLVDAVVLVDEHGAVLYANPAVQRLLGWDVQSLFGEPFTKLLPERRNGAEAALNPLIGTDPFPGAERQCGRRSSVPTAPNFLWTWLSPSSIPTGAAPVIGVISDASDRIDIERYQRVSEDLLAFLAGASGTTEEIVPKLLAILCSTLDFELATAWRWDPDSECSL